MNVSAIIPTRGNVDLGPVLAELPREWEQIIYDNGAGMVTRFKPATEDPGHIDGGESWANLPDLGPHARFAAIEYASHDLIFVVDDDVIVSDPAAIVDAWLMAAVTVRNTPHRIDEAAIRIEFERADHIVCNIPDEFLKHYPDNGMVGFGAAFHRDTPELAFARFFAKHKTMKRDDPLFLRESCRIVTTLTPIVRVDVPKTDREFASDPDRLWKQRDHFWAAQTMIKLARIARDA